jgi:hypothetical protein
MGLGNWGRDCSHQATPLASAIPTAATATNENLEAMFIFFPVIADANRTGQL